MAFIVINQKCTIHKTYTNLSLKIDDMSTSFDGMKEIAFDRIFNKANLEKGFEKGEYISCTFQQLVLTGMDLADSRFEDCQFERCDLSNISLKSSYLQGCEFTDCKLLGIRFDLCNVFGLDMNFESCQLDFSSFFQLKLPGKSFRSCSLKECDFIACDLSKANFQDCQLQGALFEETQLRQADFRGAVNYLIDPDKNSIKGAHFSNPEVLSLLAKYQIKID